MPGEQSLLHNFALGDFYYASVVHHFQLGSGELDMLVHNCTFGALVTDARWADPDGDPHVVPELDWTTVKPESFVKKLKLVIYSKLTFLKP